MEFNKTELSNFRKDFKEMVKVLEKKNNIFIETGSISYDENSFTMKINAIKKPENGISLEQTKFEEYCNIFGFKKEDYKKEVRIPGETTIYQFIGFKPKARKNTCIIRNPETETNYVVPDEIIKLYLTR